MVDMIESAVKQIQEQGSNQRPLPNHAVTGGMTPREGRASVLASPDLPYSRRDLGSRGRSPSQNPRTCPAEEFLRQYQEDMLALVEHMRELRRNRQQRGQR
jgi:hypothetical protein